MTILTGRLVPTAHKVIPASKRIDLKIYVGATLTDLGTSDMLVLAIDIADTTAIG